MVDVMMRPGNVHFESCNCLKDCNFVQLNQVNINERFEVGNDSDFVHRSSASIYYGDDEFVAYRRLESYGNVELLSNIGGLLGLFLGMSVLSIIETVYFFTLRFIDDLWQKPQ